MKQDYFTFNKEDILKTIQAYEFLSQVATKRDIRATKR